MAEPDVVIAGAGIAGLTAAIAFARRGLAVRLVERRTGFSEVGAGLQLSPNATRALKALGLFEAIGREAVPMQELTVRRWGDGRRIGGMSMQAAPEPDGAPFWTIRRADLQTALLDAVRGQGGVRITIGRKVVAFAERDDGAVTVAIESERGQREEIVAPLLVAADGAWSALRTRVDPGSLPEFLGYEAWRALIPAEAAPAAARHAGVNLWLGRRRHAVHYPVAAGRAINLVLVRAGRDPTPDWDRGPDKPAAPDLADGAAAELAALIAAAPGWGLWSLYDRARPHYGSGHVALIGDAAHPVLPFLAQGAALAIEDAATLGSLVGPAVGQGPAAIAEAVRAFGEARRSRAARVQQNARANARAYHAGFPVDLGRDLVMGRLGEAGMRKRHDWLYGWRPA